MVASSVANEGLNIKDINSIVVAHGGKSFFQVLQRVGRGLRVVDGKGELLVVDFDDTNLGRWFANHTIKRAQMYVSIGGEDARPIRGGSYRI